eukprot:GHVS01045082.1.p1 GENE.GHVS01045082.1~~GHVS01045082.1.p1  ORF type:complete len:131 (+),score=3.46 GHVS01045082.1:269-661(+)
MDFLQHRADVHTYGTVQSMTQATSSDSDSITYSATTAIITSPLPLVSCAIKAGPTGIRSTCGGMCYCVADTFLTELWLWYGGLSLWCFSLSLPLLSRAPFEIYRILSAFLNYYWRTSKTVYNSLLSHQTS